MRRGSLIKKTAALLAALFVLSAAFPGSRTVRAEDDGRYRTFTLHSGDMGYFGDPSVREKESVQFVGDIFYDMTVPDPADDSAVFVGWSDTEGADEANVFDSVTYVDGLGSDLYAVWSKKVYVTYNVMDGYLEVDGQQYERVVAECDAGSKFRILQPEHMNGKIMLFAGWYTDQFGEGTRFDENTVLHRYDQEVSSDWVFNDDALMPMLESTPYIIPAEGGGQYYRFTPSETDVYRIYTYDLDREGEATAYIRLLDEHTRQVADSDAYDLVGNTELVRELEAGNTYYFQFREGGGNKAEFTVRIERHAHATVTFHANAGDSAFFDGDPAKKEKQIEIPIGEYITTYDGSGLTVADGLNIRLLGWSLYDDADTIEGGVQVNGPIDVYAVYAPYDRVILDANGGYFNTDPGLVTVERAFGPGQVFDDIPDPRHPDITKKFMGWATTRDASEPDIMEGETRYEDLPERIYALFSDKVLITFLGNGGYFLGNPERTVFTASAGRGRVFYGMSVFNADLYIKPAGWYDQHGIFVPFTPDNYNGYTIKEDTVFTTVWERELSIYGNGGYIVEYGNAWAIDLRFGLDDLFSMNGLTVGHDDPYMKFLGWSSDPSAVRPDITEGVTPVSELTEVFAVWKNTRYEFVTGENPVYVKGSGDLRIEVRDVSDDTDTFDNFHDLIIDGLWVNPTHYRLGKGSVIIDLDGEYLDRLSEGEHDVMLTFYDGTADTVLTVRAEAPAPDGGGRENPDTGVSVPGTAAFTVIAAAFMFLRRKDK